MQSRIFLLFIVFVIAITGCDKKNIGGNGVVITQERKINGFKAVNIKGAYDIYLKKGNIDNVVIEADSNLIPIIVTELNDSVLSIYNTKTIIRSKELKVIITCPELNSLDFSGATELTCDSDLLFKDLNINISGAGKIDMGLKADNLNAIVSGGAIINFRGKTINSNISITGAGNIDAQKFETDNCKIDISGFGRAKLNVIKKLEVNISGYGKVDYTGNPEIKQSITGAGKIRKKG
jgi:hypothetical protein